MVSFQKVVEGGNEGGTIVSNDFIEGTPTTNDVFEDPVADGSGSFVAKVSPFWPGCE
jgi:hypothetical protein